MKTKEAIQLIIGRIVELLEDENIRKQMIEKRQAGEEQKEIQEWLTHIAIASLYGQDKKK